MSQVDLVTFPVIIVWLFILFCISFWFFNNYFFVDFTIGVHKLDAKVSVSLLQNWFLVFSYIQFLRSPYSIFNSLSERLQYF